MDDRASLVERTYELFGDVSRPSELVSEPDGPFAESIVRDFSGRLWQEQVSRSLNSHWDAMVLFTPEAYRYYLPAYLVFALANPAEEDFSDIILFHFRDYGGPRWCERMQLFTSDQLDLVGEILEVTAEETDQEDLEKALLGLEMAKANNSFKPQPEGCSDAGDAGAA